MEVLRSLKVLAMLLAAVFTTAAVPAASWSISAAHMDRSAGCHHQLPAPTPARGSHQYCAAGHQWAVLGTPIVVPPLAVRVEVDVQAEKLESFVTKNLPLALITDGWAPM